MCVDDVTKHKQYFMKYQTSYLFQANSSPSVSDKLNWRAQSFTITPAPDLLHLLSAPSHMTYSQHNYLKICRLYVIRTARLAVL